MARNIAIRKLARRLGRSPEDLVRTLGAMGHSRFASADDVLPGELAERLVARVHAPKAPARAPADDFESLMRSEGVTRLGTSKSARKPMARKPPPAAAPRRAAVASRTDRANPHAAQRKAAPAPEYARELEQVLNGTRDRLRNLEHELASVQDQQHAEAVDHEGRVRQLEHQLAAEHRARLGAEARAHEAEGQLAARDADAARVPSLRELLAERGLMGEDEEAEALIAVLRSRRLGVLASSLVPSDLARLRRLLVERVVLHCGRKGCPVPGGMAPVVVAEARCEVCAGSNMARGFARLSEALMLNGLRRITIVGGTVGYHRHIRQGIDERIEVKLVEGTRRRTRRQADRDVDGSQLVVVWGGSLDDAAVHSLYGAADVRVLRVEQRSMGGLLQELTEALAT